MEWKTCGVTVMISVSEDPEVSPALRPVQGFDFCVVLAVQWGLTNSFILEQLQFILRAHKEHVAKRWVS